MKRFLLILGFLIVLFTVLSAVAQTGQAPSRPAYANDLVKLKLSTPALRSIDLPAELNAEASIDPLSAMGKLMAEIGGKTLIRAHRSVKDKVWEAEQGFDRWVLVSLDGRKSVEEALAILKGNSLIEDASPEFYAYLQIAPNDPYYSQNWGHNNTGQGPGGGGIGFDSNAPEGWDLDQGFGSPDVIIGLIDSGVNYNHVDLNDNCVPGYDYGANDSNPMDSNGHGSQCAGVSAGEANNGVGVAGVAGGCKIMPIKVMNNAGDITFTAITNGITHAADNDADVISMSIGAESGTEEGDYPSCDTALYYAYNAGCTILAATANSNTSAIAYPSNHTSVISVGAASPTGQRKSTSSSDGQNWWGSNYGVNIQDDPKAVDIMAATILPATTAGGSYSTDFNGTSCATPYAAGVAALIISKDPGLTPAEVRQAIVSSATDMTIDGGVGWDRYTGYGMINAYGALLTVAPGMPSCTITSPANNTSFDLGSTISVTVNAGDSNGTIANVSFYIDNNLAPMFTDDSAPYAWDWDTQGFNPWGHTIKAVATDNENNARQSQINVLLRLPADEGFESGAFGLYAWENLSPSPWVIQSTDTYSGIFAAKAGTITHLQTTTLSVSLNVTSEGYISFFSKVSSEMNYDYLRFYIDGAQQAQWSGSLNWAQQSYLVNPGLRTFAWTYYKDQGVNTGSDTAWLDHIIFPPHNSVPTTPSNLTATVLSPSTIALDWVDNSTDETEFYLESSMGGGPWLLVDWALADATSMINSGLSPLTFYSYRVRAHNANGDSNYSNVANAWTLGTDCADHVTVNAEANQVILSWEAPLAGCDSYEIWRYAVVNGNLVNGFWLGNLTGTELSFTDPEWHLQSPGDYRWEVISIMNSVQSQPSLSNILTKVPNGTIRGTVSDLEGVPLENATVTCGGLSAATNTLGEYIFSVLPGTYSLTAVLDEYEDVTWESIVVTSGQETLLNFLLPDAVANNDLTAPAVSGIQSVYPNPFNSNLNISVSLKDSRTPYVLSIYNLRGERVYSHTDTQKGDFMLSWDGRDKQGRKLASGMYLLKLSSGEETQVRKILMQ